jgi:flagellar biosynthesis protein FliR
MALFWESGNYSSAYQAMVKSFAMVNGDNLYGIFEPNFEANYLAGYIYMFVFFVLFNNTMHNIFISIISEGFSSLQKKPIRREGEADFTPKSPKTLAKKKFFSNYYFRKEV